MPLNPVEWHKRFVQQAHWTSELRRQLLNRCNIQNTSQVLEVGCGTGAVLREFNQCVGLDIETNYLLQSHANAPKALLVQGDAHELPFSSGIFDLVYSHFLLLWVKSPLRVVKEMVRVTRHGGNIIAFAEPDYGGRIDFPNELSIIGELQEKALKKQGADTRIGRRLSALFHQAGIRNVESGILGGHWKEKPSKEGLENEWYILQDDLSNMISPNKLRKYREIDQDSWERGERVLFVPTFYAWGWVD